MTVEKRPLVIGYERRVHAACTPACREPITTEGLPGDHTVLFARSFVFRPGRVLVFLGSMEAEHVGHLLYNAKGVSVECLQVLHHLFEIAHLRYPELARSNAPEATYRQAHDGVLVWYARVGDADDICRVIKGTALELMHSFTRAQDKDGLYKAARWYFRATQEDKDTT